MRWLLEVPSSPIFALSSRWDSGSLRCAGRCADVGRSLPLLGERNFPLHGNFPSGSRLCLCTWQGMSLGFEEDTERVR